MWNYFRNLSKLTSAKNKTIAGRSLSRPLRTTEKSSVVIDNHQVDFTLVTSRLARNVRLVVHPEKGLQIITPFRFNRACIHEIINSKKDWIIRHLHESSHRKASAPRLENGAVISILGIPKTVEIIATSKSKPSLLEISDRIILRLPNRHKISDTQPEVPLTSLYQKNIKTLFEKHFREVARHYLEKRTAEISATMGTHYNRIAIRSQKSRWGSCSRQNNLNYNWKLVFMPLPVIDYLVIHELSHTVHHNHGKRFHAMVEKFCPDHRALQKILHKTQTPV